MASPPRRSRPTVTRDAEGMIPTMHPCVKQVLYLGPNLCEYASI